MVNRSELALALFAELRGGASVYYEGKIQTATRINNSNLIHIILYIINNYGPASNY